MIIVPKKLINSVSSSFNDAIIICCAPLMRKYKIPNVNTLCTFSVPKFALFLLLVITIIILIINIIIQLFYYYSHAYLYS